MKNSSLSDWQVRHLAIDLTKRRILSRYRGSIFGLAWAILLPLAMLAVYSLVFNHFLGVRWPGAESEGGLSAALRIYLGLIVLNFVAENLTAAPQLLLENPSYVKKVVFPLPILAYVATAASVVQLVISLLVAGGLALFALGTHPQMLIFSPIVLLPLVVWMVALHWWFSALGVYIRDLTHLAGPMVTVLLFLSPVFYSLEQIGGTWSSLLLLNPLTLPIEQLRNLLFGSSLPDFEAILLSLICAMLAAILGRLVFRYLKPGFADVL